MRTPRRSNGAAGGPSTRCPGLHLASLGPQSPESAVWILASVASRHLFDTKDVIVSVSRFETSDDRRQSEESLKGTFSLTGDVLKIGQVRVELPNVLGLAG